MVSCVNVIHWSRSRSCSRIVVIVASVRTASGQKESELQQQQPKRRSNILLQYALKRPLQTISSQIWTPWTFSSLSLHIPVLEKWQFENIWLQRLPSEWRRSQRKKVLNYVCVRITNLVLDCRWCNTYWGLWLCNKMEITWYLNFGSQSNKVVHFEIYSAYCVNSIISIWFFFHFQFVELRNHMFYCSKSEFFA